MKRIIVGIMIALIGMFITIFGLYITSNLDDNRIYRMSGYGLVLIGILIAPGYQSRK